MFQMAPKQEELKCCLPLESCDVLMKKTQVIGKLPSGMSYAQLAVNFLLNHNTYSY